MIPPRSFEALDPERRLVCKLRTEWLIGPLRAMRFGGQFRLVLSPRWQGGEGWSGDRIERTTCRLRISRTVTFLHCRDTP